MTSVLRLIMRSSKTGHKTSCIASAVWHVAPSCWKQVLPISFSSIFGNKNSFSMARYQNPLQTLTRYGCLGFSMYACGFSVPQMRKFCLFTYPPRSKWASSEKMFFYCRHFLYVYCRSNPKRCGVYTTIFVRRKNKTNYMSNQTWTQCYHSRN